jgi:hypothetical protein
MTHLRTPEMCTYIGHIHPAGKHIGGHQDFACRGLVKAKLIKHLLAIFRLHVLGETTNLVFRKPRGAAGHPGAQGIDHRVLRIVGRALVLLKPSHTTTHTHTHTHTRNNIPYHATEQDTYLKQ